ncbi:MAG: Rne/Rng family ribonuclease, partial [Rickettsiales bacterium]|nr:Rne/Rng family ribonuclease [Rickettsiales bacterium]
MSKRIMIDAVHPEETRIVITDGDRVREFDYESTVKKQLKGNVYLAKITRVEPSLQAAFVDYGGDKHGFLPFSEIHPDYFQLPVEAKKELLASLNASFDDSFDEAVVDDFDDENSVDQDEEFFAESDAIDEADEGDEVESNEASSGIEDDSEASSEVAEAEEASAEDAVAEQAIDTEDKQKEAVDAPQSADASFDQSETNQEAADQNEAEAEVGSTENDEGTEQAQASDAADESNQVNEENASEGAVENAPAQRRRKPKKDVAARQRSIHKQYRINEVIKRGQLVQVQVIKEERGNKGASLTSYVSLAGRYCVFMPRSNGQGGVSRRITNYDDRRRLKEYLTDIGVNNNQGSVIVRTAGADKNKEEIQRDYEYLKKLWDDIREMTLASTAPSFIHTEGDIIRRFIKDYFNNSIDEIVIEGENAYRAARGFVKMIMPSSVKKVRRHRYKTPIFTKFGIENQIMQLYKNVAHMPSGGYIVINPTEALISIDVNSGKSTSGKDVEETALHSNIEAAKEIARQLRLRDLSGLVVIDFIDMISPKNRRMVEKTLKEEFKTDRAKVQIGRISLFGLLEMSRQR